MRVFISFVENDEVGQGVVHSNVITAIVRDRLHSKLVVGFQRIIVMVQHFAVKLEIHFRLRIISLKFSIHVVTDVFLNLSFRIIVAFALYKGQIFLSVIFLTIGFKCFEALLPFRSERLLYTIEVLALLNGGVVLAETAVVTINCFGLVQQGEEMYRNDLPSKVISIIIMFNDLLRLHLDSVQLQDGLVEDLRQKEKYDARHYNIFQIQAQKGLNTHVGTIPWFVENQFTVIVGK